MFLLPRKTLKELKKVGTFDAFDYIYGMNEALDDGEAELDGNKFLDYEEKDATFDSKNKTGVESSTDDDFNVM